ncbi:TIGR03118 family protein [Pseudoduganella sp. FT25W]|uniref:TIGR03118 family protein n=1 Tax=Duganella alba TaxID=2666081 RepID=A0A6L5QJR4_9BURK|nr:TIGR03118 family protein [Duganella alba]MRX09542.1 TIGR03118 family protein [Duganella alba]MRX18315.1 TIGR03118 family protein [Duganella alba]
MRTALSLSMAATLAACGGSGYGGGDMPVAPPPVVSNTLFTVTSLVADSGTAAAHSDAKLINPWGIAFNPTGFVWVANNGSNSSTLYDGNGVPQSLVVATPDAPTGIAYNGSSDFKITQNGVTAASPFIFAGENGSISAWSPTVNRNNTVTAVDGAGTQVVYKGLAIAAYNGANYLYATDFHHGRIDVYDAAFNKATLPGAFQDAALPAGYAPFGIQAVGDRIYVSYAQRATTGDDDVKGAGLGAIDVFDTAGNLVKQLVKGGALNAPWGMAVAPANFGTYSGKLLVANFGDGKINAYDTATGAISGTVSKTDGSAVAIDGLWGIAFGPGVNSQPTNTLFFTAGPGDEAHGLYGRIDMM